MNLCAVSNVRNHLHVKMHESLKAEEKARKENMTQECINMHHDMYLLYMGLIAELDNIEKEPLGRKEKANEAHER